MRLNSFVILAATLLLTVAFTNSFADVQADATTALGSLTSNPTPYSGTNGGAEDLTLDFIPDLLLPLSAGDDGAILPQNTGTLTLTGGTPGGSGLLIVSFAQVDVSAFGVSFLVAPDAVNMANYFYFGYDATGSLIVPNVSQSYPNLAGIDTYIQGYEYAPGAKSSNGLVFPLLP